MTEYHFELYADYHQFYLQDEQAGGDLSDSWTRQTVENRLALAHSTIGVGTARNSYVPVTLEIRDSAPDDHDFGKWDRINECSISAPSGKLVIAGCTDCFSTAQRITVAPWTYRARIYYGGLNTVTDNDLNGSDHYKIALWPADYAEPRILKEELSLNKG